MPLSCGPCHHENIKRYADIRDMRRIFSYNALALKKAWSYPTIVTNEV
jgi:hypothetical protein